MYQFKFSLNDDDYFEFNKYHMFNAPASKKSLAFSKLLFPILLAVILLLHHSVHYLDCIFQKNLYGIPCP